MHVERVTIRFPKLRSKGYTPLLAYPVNSKKLTSEKSFFWETLVEGVCPHHYQFLSAYAVASELSLFVCLFLLPPDGLEERIR